MRVGCDMRAVERIRRERVHRSKPYLHIAQDVPVSSLSSLAQGEGAIRYSEEKESASAHARETIALSCASRFDPAAFIEIVPSNF